MERILFIHPTNDFTGSTRVLANIFQEEYKDRHIEVVTSDEKKQGMFSNMQNVTIISTKHFKFHGHHIRKISGLLHCIYCFFFLFRESHNYDIFYINTIVPWYAAVAGRLTRKKIIWHVHEKFLDNNSSHRWYEYVFNHTKAERIFVSQYLINQYPRRTDCKSYVKYNKLPKAFTSQVQIKPIKQRSLNNIIMLSSLNKEKGLFTFMGLAKRMPENNFTLIISSDMGKIKAFFTEEIPSNVCIVPKQSDIHPFLQVNDLILNLSIPFLCVETFGMTLIEAMSYGIPAIAPNVGGPLEVIKNGYNGYCINVTNIDEIVEHINIILDKQNYPTFVNNALEQIKKFRY